MLQNQNGENVVGDTLEDLVGVDSGAFDGLPEGEVNQFSDLPNANDKPGKVELTGPYLSAYSFFVAGIHASFDMVSNGYSMVRAGAPKVLTDVMAEVTAASFVQLAEEYKKVLVLLQQNNITPPDSRAEAEALIDGLMGQLSDFIKGKKGDVKPDGENI